MDLSKFSRFCFGIYHRSFFPALSLSIELSILLWNYLPIIKKREVGRGVTHAPFSNDRAEIPKQKGGQETWCSQFCGVLLWNYLPIIDVGEGNFSSPHFALIGQNLRC